MALYADINGVSLRYAIDGPPVQDRVPVVLIHEIGGALESWDGVVACLPELRILRYDLRGFGLSEKPRKELLLDDLVEDLGCLLDLTDMSTVILVGGAIGAGIALAAAPRLSQRVLGVVACAPATGVSENRKSAVRELADHIEHNGLRDFVLNDTIPSAWPETIERDAARFEKFRGLQLGADPSRVAAIFRMLASMPPDLVEQVVCPALLVSGKHDVARPPEMVAALAARMVNGTSTVIDSGHFMAQQSPRTIADLIRSAHAQWTQ